MLDAVAGAVAGAISGGLVSLLVWYFKSRSDRRYQATLDARCTLAEAIGAFGMHGAPWEADAVRIDRPGGDRETLCQFGPLKASLDSRLATLVRMVGKRDARAVRDARAALEDPAVKGDNRETMRALGKLQAILALLD